MIKFYVTRTRYHRVGHIFITFIYGLSAIREILLKYLIAFSFSGLSENASHICRNPASVTYTSVCADAGECGESAGSDPSSLHVSEPPGAGGPRRPSEQQPDHSDVGRHQQSGFHQRTGLHVCLPVARLLFKSKGLDWCSDFGYFETHLCLFLSVIGPVQYRPRRQSRWVLTDYDGKDLWKR